MKKFLVIFILTLLSITNIAEAETKDIGQELTINIPNNYDNHTWATLAWHALTIKVDPLDENILYVGGLDLHKSINSGNSWTKLSNWALMYEGGGNAYVHADIHSINFRNNNPDEFTITSEMIHRTLPSNQLLRSWDNVPRYAKAQEVVGSRLLYGNYVQGYSMTDVNVDLSQDIISKSIDF